MGRDSTPTLNLDPGFQNLGFSARGEHWAACEVRERDSSLLGESPSITALDSSFFRDRLPTRAG
jgi:hypothetical protein